MSFTDFISTTWDFLLADNNKTPDTELPLNQVDLPHFNNHDSGQLNVTGLGHSSLIIKIDGYKILTDPVFEKRVVITGATGMVGGCALRLCLENPDVSQVTVIGRKSTGINDARMREVVADNFTDFSAMGDTLKNQDLALYCLGAYTGAVPDDLFREITVDSTLAFAKALFRASPQAAFCFLSGQGADRTEKSRMAFARYKGAAENALLEIGFSRLHIFRTGYIYPVTPRKEPNPMYTTTRFLYPLLRRLYPNIDISSKDLAAAMVHVGFYEISEKENSTLENKDIRFKVKPW
jgi:uncharacterized protein YbjT (DUF2867 family)